MAEMYIWEPHGDKVGHCSLKLDDGSYVSFWPCGDYGISQVAKNETIPSTSSTYENDKVLEGNRNPNRTISIKGRLNNPPIHTWWMRNMASGYNMQSCNCTTIVESALKVGGLDPNE
jgi:hypothetical protein